MCCYACSLICLFFFFSSRRRHTRCSRDWSSDVCSSDLTGARALLIVGLFGMGVSIAALPWAGSSLLVYAWTVPLAFTNSLFAPAASGLEIGRASCRERV